MIHEKLYLYEDREDVFLRTYVLEDSPEMLNGKRRPAVLICPGGAYLYCSDRETEPMAVAFNMMGYHAFVLNYSVQEKAKYPTPLVETAKAMLMIREHQEEWLVDTEKIALCGFSAGAHNVALYGGKWNSSKLAEMMQTESEKLRPAAVITGYLLNDLRDVKEEEINEEQKKMLDYYRQSYFGTKHPTVEAMDAASPSKNVSKDTPPMFLWATFEDTVVPVDNTLTMANALAEAQVPFELHIYESGDHGLALATQATAANTDQINSCAGTWLAHVQSWLRKHIPLPIPER